MIERAREAAGDPLVVARIMKSGPAFAGWTTYPSRSSARQIASVVIVLPTPERVPPTKNPFTLVPPIRREEDARRRLFPSDGRSPLRGAFDGADGHESGFVESCFDTGMLRGRRTDLDSSVWRPRGREGKGRPNGHERTRVGGPHDVAGDNWTTGVVAGSASDRFEASPVAIARSYLN